MNSNNYIQHYGVKGMKWGVRKKAKKLSNSELQTAINRMRLEDQYVKLSRETSPMHRTTKFIENIGKQGVNQVYSSVIAEQVAKPLNRKINLLKGG